VYNPDTGKMVPFDSDLSVACTSTFSDHLRRICDFDLEYCQIQPCLNIPHKFITLTILFWIMTAPSSQQQYIKNKWNL